MKPLSTAVFMRGSVRKILPLMLTTALAVALIYFLSMLMGQLGGQIREVSSSSLTDIAVLYANEGGVEQADLAALQANKDIREIYVAGIRSVNYNLALGSPATTYLFLVSQQDLKKVLAAQKLSLAEGRLPQKPMEAVLNRKLAANNGLAVGSIVKKGTFGWQVEADVSVVGLTDGPAIVGVALGSPLKPTDPGASLILACDSTVMPSVSGFVETSFGKKYKVNTQPMAMAATAKVTMAYTVITVFTGLVLVLVLGFLLGNISMIQYEQRRKEFQLLNAVGYPSRFLSGKVFKEIASSGMMGWAAGILLALLVGWLTNVVVFSERGMEMALLNLPNMAAMLLIPAFITLFGIAAPLRMFKFKDI